MKYKGIDLKISLNARCDINGIDHKITGKGRIHPQGVYSAKLEFSDMPEDFHPVAVSGFLVSLCCGYASVTRNSAVNMMTLGVMKYSSKRRLDLGKLGVIEIEGDVRVSGDDVTFDGQVRGNCKIPDDVISIAYYNSRWTPKGEGEILERGVGSYFRVNGEEIPVKMSATYSFDKSVTLKNPQFGIISESGVIDDNAYSIVLHSIRDRENTMAKLME